VEAQPAAGNEREFECDAADLELPALTASETTAAWPRPRRMPRRASARPPRLKRHVNRYPLPTSEGVSHFGKEYASMPDLIVDAANKGNIGRFFNDNSFRNGEYQSDEAVNVGVTWVFDLVPHLVFFATRDVAPGEELISKYGKQFWSVNRALRRQEARDGRRHAIDSCGLPARR